MGLTVMQVPPGRANPDHRTNFCFEGDVDGQDVYTVDVEKHQLGVMAYVNVPQMCVGSPSLFAGRSHGQDHDRTFRGR
jgi:hypothetical protein